MTLTPEKIAELKAAIEAHSSASFAFSKDVVLALLQRLEELEGDKVKLEPFGYERGEPWQKKPTARALSEAIAELAINDRSGLIQRVRFLILRDRATTNQTFAAIQARAEAAESSLAQAKAEMEEMLAALKRITAPRDCGCVPCVGHCSSQSALEIEVDAMRDIAAEAIAKAEGRTDV